MIFLDFNIVQTLMLSIFLYLFGSFLTNKIHILYKLCIPPPVVGGLLFSLLVFILEYFKKVSPYEIKSHIQNDNGIFRLTISSQNNVIFLLNFLYNNDFTALERKYNLAKQYFYNN